MRILRIKNIYAQSINIHLRRYYVVVVAKRKNPDKSLFDIILLIAHNSLESFA